jgi:hypothetical protein
MHYVDWDRHADRSIPIIDRLPLPIACSVCRQTRSLAKELWKKLAIEEEEVVTPCSYYYPRIDCIFVRLYRLGHVSDLRITKLFDPIAITIFTIPLPRLVLPATLDFSSRGRDRPLNVYFIMPRIYHHPENRVVRMDIEPAEPVPLSPTDIPEHRCPRYDWAVDWIKEMKELGTDVCPMVTLVEYLPVPQTCINRILGLD